MSEHVQEKWYAQFTGGVLWEIYTEDSAINIADVYGGTQEMDAARARLIASAPETKEQRDELLEVLQEIDDIPFRHYPDCKHFLLGDCDCGIIVMQKVHAVVANATRS